MLNNGLCNSILIKRGKWREKGCLILVSVSREENEEEVERDLMFFLEIKENEMSKIALFSHILWKMDANMVYWYCMSVVMQQILKN